MILFEQNHIPAEIVHNQIRTKERKILLDQRRKEYFPLLSVHTLEIGYNTPQAAIEKEGDTSKELFKEKTILSYFDKDKNEI